MYKQAVIGFLLAVNIFTSSALALQAPAAVGCKRLFNKQNAADQALTQNLPFSELKSFRIMSYNVENLFAYAGEFVRKDGFHLDAPRPEADKQPRAKSPIKTEAVGKVIEEISPHFGILTEVESLETLRNFVRDHLNDSYDSFLITGNDPRGINIGFIARKNLQVKIESLTNKDRQWPDPTTGELKPLFSRDLPVWIVRTGTAEKPVAIILGMHAKSKRDRNGDPESNHWRAQQLITSVQIVKELEQKYGADVPIIMGGDFNTDVRRAPEAEALRVNLLDSFETAERGPPIDDRTTHTYHPENGPTQYQQLDGLFVTKALTKRILNANVYRYKDENGNPKPLPSFFREREENPSDHFPIYIDVAR